MRLTKLMSIRFSKNGATLLHVAAPCIAAQTHNGAELRYRTLPHGGEWRCYKSDAAFVISCHSPPFGCLFMGLSCNTRHNHTEDSGAVISFLYSPVTLLPWAELQFQVQPHKWAWRCLLGGKKQTLLFLSLSLGLCLVLPLSPLIMLSCNTRHCHMHEGGAVLILFQRL